MRLAHELEPGTFYRADFNDELLLFCDHLDEYQDGKDGLTFITMHYRWVRHEFQEDYYQDQIFTINFEWAEQFDYSPEIYVINEELP